MLQFLSAVAGGVLASAAGALVAAALLAGLRRVGHLRPRAPERHTVERPARR